MPQIKLKINEIFFSIQGEAQHAGWPSIFIRLSGCPLRCRYCDTAYAFYEGQYLSLEQIKAQIKAYPTSFVCVTGGEPLAQPNCIILLEELVQRYASVSIETSGMLPIDSIPKQVTVVMDIKTPGSGEHEKMLWRNLEVLKSKDQIKFVLQDREDYQWALQWLRTHPNLNTSHVWFSPVYETLAPQQLAEWMLEDGCAARLQTQLHKTLWGDTQGK